MLWLREKFDGLSYTEQPSFGKHNGDVFACSLIALTVANTIDDAV